MQSNHNFKTTIFQNTFSALLFTFSKKNTQALSIIDILLTAVRFKRKLQTYFPLL